MSISYSGSVSNTPPSGPEVDLPPDATRDNIGSIMLNISTCQTAFTSSYETYSSLLVPYTTLQGYVDQYTAGTITAEQLLAYYNGLEFSSITSAGKDLLAKSTSLTDAVAYEQLFYAQTSANTISSEGSVLLSNADVTTAAKRTIQAILDSLTTLKSNLGTAFLNYRHSVYVEARAQTAFDQAQINYNIALCGNIAGTVSAEDLAAAQQAMSSAQAALTQTQSDEASYKGTLDTATASIDTAYTTVKNVGAGVMPTAPAETVATEVTALEASYAQQQATLSQLVTASQTPSASTITLPVSSSPISMTQLMTLLGEAQALSIQVARRSALSAATINAFGAQASAVNLISLGGNIGILTTLAGQIQSLVDEYNSGVDSGNAALLSKAEAEYNFYAQNRSTINGVINAVNTSYENNDATIKALLDAASQINQSTLDAASSETLSETASESILLQQTPPPGYTISSLPPYAPISNLSGADFATFDGNTTIDDVNAAFTSLLEKIAPILPQIEAALSSLPNAPSDLSLTPAAAYETYNFSTVVTQPTINQLTTILNSYQTQQTAGTATGAAQSATEADMLLRLLVILGQGLNFSSSGALASLGVSFGATSAAVLKKITSSSLFYQTIQAIFANASMFAGLQVAGTPGTIMAGLTGTTMTLAEYLEAQSAQPGSALESATNTQLANAMLQQLALIVTTPGVLQTYAAGILQASPASASLSEADKRALLSALVSVLQSTVISAMVLLAASQGLSAGALATTALGTGATTTAAIAAQFTALGIPAQTANELAAAISGQTPFLQALQSMNLDDKTRAELMVVIAANEANVSLTSGVPGGPAFLMTILQDLASKGITLPSTISGPTFLAQLAAQLLALATTPQQSAAIRQALLQPTATVLAGTMSTNDLVAQFVSAGIPKEEAAALATAIPGESAYIYAQVLQKLNYDATTKAQILALIVANQGNVALPQGTLSSILKSLSSNGITLPPTISGPNFMAQLATQLTAQATPEQTALIQQAFLPSSSTLFSTVAQQTKTALGAVLAAPSTTSGGAMAAVSPSSILSQFSTQFSALSPTVQQTLLAQVTGNPALANLPGITPEQTAALMLAVRTGALTAPEAGSLIALAAAQAGAPTQNLPLILSTLQTSLVTNLFTPTEEEKRVQEEAVRTDIQRPYRTPSTVSPQTLDLVSSAFRQYFVDVSDKNLAAMSTEAFAQTIQTIANFPQVAANYLTSPGMIILRAYSLRTRTAQDRSMRQDVTMTG